MSKPLVLVTGGSGYVASHVCRLLASTGLYQVRTTVRTKSPEKTQHLEDLGIEIIDNVELLASDGWDDVTKGCSFVHHCASPFFFAAPGGDPTSGFLTPALEGTKNVVEAAIRSTTVQRIVLTSSCAAVTWGHAANHPEGTAHVWNENDWQEDNTLEFGAYRMSKSEAEKEAWKLVRGTKVELATICPSFVLGPVLSPRADAASIMFMKGMLDGTTKKMTASSFGVVDVRNVADGHVAAMTVDLNQHGLKNDRGEARFILSSECSYPHIDLANVLRTAEEGTLFGDRYPIPTESEGPPSQDVMYSNARARIFLGVEFIPLEKSLVDGAKSLEHFSIVHGSSSGSSSL